MGSKFNPAVYVQQIAGKKYLPLQAKLAWMAHERPGWRIVADKEMTIIAVPDTDENGNQFKKGVAVGAVSLIDDKGVRIQTVRVDGDATIEGFAGDMFMNGSELLLEMAGYSVERIPKKCWQEYLSVFGMDNKLNNDNAKGIPPTRTGVNFEPTEDLPDIAVAEPESLPEDMDIMAIFTRLVKEKPDMVPGFIPNISPDDPAAMERLFDRYCYSVAGEGWESMDEDGQSRVKERILADFRH